MLTTATQALIPFFGYLQEQPGKGREGRTGGQRKNMKERGKKSVDSGLEIEDIWGRASTNIGMI